MKAQLLVLSAAGLLLAAAPLATASAASPAVARYVGETTSDAGARLSERGVDLGGRPLRIKVTVRADRLNNVRLAQSTGSAELDDQVVLALRNLRTDAVPPELLGRELTLTLGGAAPHAAVAIR